MNVSMLDGINLRLEEIAIGDPRFAPCGQTSTSRTFCRSALVRSSQCSPIVSWHSATQLTSPDRRR